MGKIVKVDFDGTIVEHAFPEIGEPLPYAFEVLGELQEAGYRLILWTCREDHLFDENQNYLEKAVDFCRENGIVFDAVNSALEDEDFRRDDYLKRKPFAHVHIDDRNLGGFPGWLFVREMLL